MQIFRYLFSGVLFFSFIFPFNDVKAQKDAGLWANVSLNHQVTRRISVSLSEQIRLNQNVSQVDQVFTDAGITYQWSKSFRTGISYRLSFRNEIEFYETRHRFYVDLSYRLRKRPVSMTIRQRFQQQYSGLNTSENGDIPEWYSRTKLAVKYDLSKKYTPYVSVEAFYLIDNDDEDNQTFDQMRYEAGFDYDFNRRHSLNLFYMVQTKLLGKESTKFISGIGYTYSF